MKRALSLLLALATVLGIFSMTAMAANPFTDVPENAWYYSDIDHAYQMNLINGKTATKFMPDDYLTYAEAVKLAAAMNQRYTTGSVTLQNGQPWYSTYVNYCKTKGIIDVDYSWDQPATRAGYIEIFAYALPDSAMNEINTIPDGSIPDVPMSHPQSAAIYKMYRVGILQGNDLARTCNPGASIKRSEVAAILTRMMDSSKRVRFDLEPVNGKEIPLTITAQPQNATAEVGTAATMSIAVEGGKEPYKYQWYGYEKVGRNGQWLMVIGMNAAKSTTPVLTEAGELKLRCEITDAEGTKVTSDTAIVTITDTTPELKIKTQPVGGTKKPGEKMSPFVEAEGGKTPYTYQWEAEDGGTWIKVPGGTSAALNMGIGESAVGEDLIYRCVVTDANGKSVTSNSAVFTIVANVAPLKIIDQPDSVTAETGDIAEFFIEVEGGKTPYRFDWMSISGQGQHESVEGIPGIQTYDEDIYGLSELNVRVGGPYDWTTNEDFYCVVTDANGNKVNSNVFSIKLSNQPFTVTGSGPSKVKIGETVTLKVHASGGSKPYKFVWMGYNADDYSQGFTTSVISWRGVTLSADGSTLTIDTSKCEAKEFKCDVTDGNGNKQRVEFEFQVYSY